MHCWCSVIVCLMVSAGYIDCGTTDPPVFTPVVADLAENSAVGTSVVLTATVGEGVAPYTFTIDAQTTPDLGWFAVTGTDAATGLISIAAGQTVDYEHASLPGTHLYKVDVHIADSTAGTALTATITFTFTITNVNEAPVFTASAFAVQMASPQAAGTALETCDATDLESDAITYSISDTTNFAINSGNGDVTVAAGVTLTNTLLTPEVYAADDNATPLTGTGYLFVCIGTTCSGATAITGSVLAAISVFVALLMKVA